MHIGIIGAMDEEVSYLKEKMTDSNEMSIANTVFTQGMISNKQITLVKSGIGKVNAAMNTSILIDRYHPDYIINTGTSGGFSEQLEVGDVVVSDKVAYHDVDITDFGYDYGQVPGCPTYFKADDNLTKLTTTILNELGIAYNKGLIATGDSFMNNQKRINAVLEAFPNVIALEMEAAAISQVCFQFNTPFIIIRALSDIAGKESTITFEQFVDLASKNAAKIILKLINKI